ncbi:MAG: CRTAC1 family protein [Planctomycetota bacterium]|nr:CRTAC1 family protein [Planctomycetota bacterium]
MGIVLPPLLASCREEPAGDVPAAARSRSSEVTEARRKLDRTVWSREVAAQRHEAAFTALWDRLNREDDEYSVLGGFRFGSLWLGKSAGTERLERGIRRLRFGEPESRLSPPEWRQLLDRLKKRGFRLEQSEWHHVAFESPAGAPPRSTIALVLHVRNDGAGLRAIVKGRLEVEWSAGEDAAARPVPGDVRLRELTVTDRRGPPYFKEQLTASSRDTPGATEGVQPLIVYDLDRDGRSEIILGGINRVYRNLGRGRFEGESLLRFPVRMFKPGIVADFTGDGMADFVCVSRDGSARLYEADGQGRFSRPTRPLWPGRLKLPSVLTAGDVDHDGDLDLWLAQYKPPYERGQMPTPYHDANDGYPAYLLRNDGRGRFEDVTEEAGLGEKRFRRTYSSSLVDLDDDGHLDLLVVSDFAGVDIYRGDGKGRFQDVTAELIDEHHNFGMAHTFGDYDLDGRLDFYVIGMSSTTAARLDSMGLGHPDFPERNRLRPVMSFGNRMYLSRGDRYVEPAFRREVARTGWSWGATSFDVDNDGDPDLYVANGNRTGAATRDYCTRFWCHDIYTGSSNADSALVELFAREIDPLVRLEMSWDGYQHNALLMNRDGKSFEDVAYLLGAAFEFDARGVVSEDLDGDGRMDLLVVEQQWKPIAQVLHVLQNLCPEPHHWIGVRLVEEGDGRSPVGARISVHAAGRTRVERIITGDSFYSQHSLTRHFGLGAADSADWLEVTWLDGTVRRIEGPAIDRYHDVRSRP